MLSSRISLGSLRFFGWIAQAGWNSWLRHKAARQSRCSVATPCGNRDTKRTENCREFHGQNSQKALKRPRLLSLRRLLTYANGIVHAKWNNSNSVLLNLEIQNHIWNKYNSAKYVYIYIGVCLILAISFLETLVTSAL